MAARKFETLDGLRGLAALFVVALHVPPGGFIGWAPGALLAVDFFFCLSGFVLAHAYEQRLRAGMPVAEFMVRRLIRLWPLYVIALLLGLIGWVADGQGSTVRFALLGGLMIPRIGAEGALYPLNFPAWSLFYELVANFVFACLVRYLNRWTLGALMAAGIALMAVHGQVDAGLYGDEWVGALGRVLFSFFAGVAVHRFVTARTPPRTPSLAAAAWLVAIFVSPWLWASVLLLSPLLVYVAAGAEPKGVLRKVSVQLGLASYGVYVLHVPIARLFDVALPGDGGWLVLGLTIPTAFLAALVLDRRYDMPVRRRLEKAAAPLLPTLRPMRA